MAELQQQQPPPPAAADPQSNGGGVTPATIPAEPITGTTKRQRRPSVRLGEIGDHQHNNYERKTKQNHNWRYNNNNNKDLSKTMKENNNNNNSLDCVAIGSWKVRDTNLKTSKKLVGVSSSSKRIKTNWAASGPADDFEDDFDDVDRYSDQSLNLSIQFDNNNNNNIKKSHKDTNNNHNNGPNNKGENNNNNGDWGNDDDDEDEDGESDLERNGVRVWLNQLGLGRYYSIFEVHEVDDEVLPLLTLEDLKDMGINAVGSRRKMFSSIQKLGKGFS